MKFKVGDKVKIRKKLEVFKDYGGATFVSYMNKYLGRETTITRVNDDAKTYLLDGCDDWWFSDEMIEDIPNYKWIFNLEDFKNKDIAISCTKEESEIFFNILTLNGIDKWKYDKQFAKGSSIYDYASNEGIDFGYYAWYREHEFKIYSFSEIDFSQVYTKEYIDEVALNNNTITNDFNITKVKYITREQLSSIRPLKTGDIISDKESIGVIYSDKVIYITANCIETINPKAYCELIPVELIESNRDIAKAVSKYISSSLKDYYIIKDYFIPIQEEPKIKTICRVEFVVGADNLREFILEDDNEVVENDIVEVNTGGNHQYARVKDIEKKYLVDYEISEYKTCRKLSV